MNNPQPFIKRSFISDFQPITCQNHTQNHILIVGYQSELLVAAQSLAQALNRSIVVTTSPHQAVAQAQTDRPYLVILSGDEGQRWSWQVAREIRQSIYPHHVVIVSLTASSDHSWPLPDEIDAHPEIDGIFIAPLSADVMSSLSESAIAKQQCR